MTLEQYLLSPLLVPMQEQDPSCLQKMIKIVPQLNFSPPIVLNAWHPFKKLSANTSRFSCKPNHIHLILIFSLSPAQKYKGFRKANTGIDPHGGLLEFIKKDIIKNIDVHRDDDHQ